jgi:hypothetical protein
MLLRRDGDDIVAIPQPSHAWLSGQLARAWGNARFAAPRPFEDVCLAAELHDIGWLDWELAPGFEPKSGHPQEFMRVPTATHLALWREGVKRARVFGRYPALLVSLHANTIYSQYFDVAKAPPEVAGAVRSFLDEQHTVQNEIRESLRAEPLYADGARPENVEINRMMIAAFDRLSLEMCWGVTKPVTVPNVPVAGSEQAALTLEPSGAGGEAVEVDPWPFREDRIVVIAEGRRLRGRYRDVEQMRGAIADAEAVTIRVSLHAPASARSGWAECEAC